MLRVAVFEDIFFSSRFLRDMEPMSMTSLNGLIWTLFLGLLEIAYYRFVSRDMKIIRQFSSYDETKLRSSMLVAYWYAGIVFFGGGLFLFFILKF